jgi:replicative DNA helicase
MNQRELYSLEAEHGVLGALMHKPELCEEIGSTLGANAFSDDDNAMLYTMIMAGHAKGIRPDPITIGEQCETLPSGNPTLYAASIIMRNVVSPANAIQYARIVEERSQARKLYAAAERIMDMACQQGKISTQVAEAQQCLMDLTIPEETPDVIGYSEALGPVFEEMQDRLDGKAEIGIKFGLTDLDKITRGLRPGNLVIIAGKPGTGKTVLGTGLADKIATQDQLAALVFSLEMPSVELAKRSLASLAGVSKDRIESGEAICSSDEKVRLEGAVSKMTKADVRICDKPGLQFSRLCNIARFQHRASPLGLIVIDYLTLINPDAGSRHQTRSAEIGSFTRGLKALAKELGIPVVVLAQLNRAMDSRSSDARPKMSDLRDSGEIEQDADVIIMGYRDENDPRGGAGITEWNVVKCRHAKPGFCILQFQGSMQRFVNAERSFQDYEDDIEQEAAKKQSTKSMLRGYKK